ncbi:hypothetical protein Tco_0912747, partial [Tanacetum coccineum]
MLSWRGAFGSQGEPECQGDCSSGGLGRRMAEVQFGSSFLQDIGTKEINLTSSFHEGDFRLWILQRCIFEDWRFTAGHVVRVHGYGGEANPIVAKAYYESFVSSASAAYFFFTVAVAGEPESQGDCSSGGLGRRMAEVQFGSSFLQDIGTKEINLTSSFHEGDFRLWILQRCIFEDWIFAAGHVVRVHGYGGEANPIDCLQMLELIQSMAREIIREEFRHNHRRMWISLENCDINNSGTSYNTGSDNYVDSAQMLLPYNVVAEYEAEEDA